MDVAGEPFALLDAGALPQSTEGQRDRDEALVLRHHRNRGLEGVLVVAGIAEAVRHHHPDLVAPGVTQRDGDEASAVLLDSRAGLALVPSAPEHAGVVAGVPPGNPERPAQRQRHRSVGGGADEHGGPRLGPQGGHGVEEVLGRRRRVEPGPHLAGEPVEPRQ